MPTIFLEISTIGISDEKILRRKMGGKNLVSTRKILRQKIVENSFEKWAQKTLCAEEGGYAPQNCAQDPLLTNDCGYEFTITGVSINSIASLSSSTN